MKLSSRLILTALCALACFTPARSRADIASIKNADSEVDLAFGFNQLRYGESVNNQTFDTEKGWQPDVNIGAAYLSTNKDNIWLDNVYLRGDINIASGPSHYNGAVQYFNNNTVTVIPVKGTTQDDIYNFSGKIGRAFPLGNMFMITPFGDVGYHYWARKLTGIGGYQEDYENGTAMGGALLQFSPIEKVVLSLSGEAGKTFTPQLHSFGTDYDLQGRTVYEATAKLGYEFAPQFEAFGLTDFSGFDYGRSTLQNGGYEPDSATHDFRALIGLAYHFKDDVNGGSVAHAASSARMAEPYKY